MKLLKKNQEGSEEIMDKRIQGACMKKAPQNLAMKALSLYDRQNKKEKKTRKTVVILLVSLIPLLAILLAVIVPFLDYDILSVAEWLISSNTVTILGYSMIIVVSASITILMFVRIWKMRCSVSNCIKEN